ncbi:MAG TPA: S8 family serine peptidase, partial [Blastocatellia bacterium]
MKLDLRTLRLGVVCLSLTLIVSAVRSAASTEAAGPVSHSAQSTAQQAPDLNSAAPVSVSFKLDADPVVTHEDAARPAEPRGSRIELSTAEAQDYEASIVAAQHDFEEQARALVPGLHVVARLRKLANVVSMKVPGNQVAQIAALPGVQSFQVDRTYHALLDKSVPLINAPAVWSKLGGGPSAGKGIKIAIIDSGIDITNPLFSGTSFVAPAGFPQGDLAFTNSKVIVAKAFLDDGSTSPQDLFGHGTSVAGIAAGDFNTISPLAMISGVAPGAYLGNYCVLDVNGNGTEPLIASALEQAFTDGFQIANLSLGFPASATPGVLDQAVEVAISGGMTVVCAAGDDGASGKMTITSPGTALNAITVGASSNSHVVGPALNVIGPGEVPNSLKAIESMAATACGSSTGFPLGPSALFDVSLLDGDHLGCKASRLPAGSLTGKI